MGKASKLRSKNKTLKPYAKPSNKAAGQPQTRKPPNAAKRHLLPAPTIPFLPADRILLVGEGDFSFSKSLLIAHSCNSLVASSYDNYSTVIEKYPQASGNLQALEAEKCKLIYGVDAAKLGKRGASDGGGKEVKKGDFDKVVFNFPHVGGLTKDVNRQVRHNQELLIGFFKSAMPLLGSEGSIIVTIFEGEPYDLWNIRDLARHVGLKVERSFTFQPSAYPGYKHARTLGNIEGGGGWKGEDRLARTYIFKNNTAAAEPPKENRKTCSDDDSENE